MGCGDYWSDRRDKEHEQDKKNLAEFNELLDATLRALGKLGNLNHSGGCDRWQIARQKLREAGMWANV